MTDMTTGVSLGGGKLGEGRGADGLGRSSS